MPQWTRGHPEKREPEKDKWAVQDCGNHIADRVAAHTMGQVKAFTRPPEGVIVPETTWITVNCTDIISDCVREGDVYWGDALSKPACLNGLMDAIYRNRLHKYLHQRDMLRYGPPRWLDGTSINNNKENLTCDQKGQH